MSKDVNFTSLIWERSLMRCRTFCRSIKGLSTFFSIKSILAAFLTTLLLLLVSVKHFSASNTSVRNLSLLPVSQLRFIPAPHQWRSYKISKPPEKARWSQRIRKKNNNKKHTHTHTHTKKKKKKKNTMKYVDTYFRPPNDRRTWFDFVLWGSVVNSTKQYTTLINVKTLNRRCFNVCARWEFPDRPQIITMRLLR